MERYNLITRRLKEYSLPEEIEERVRHRINLDIDIVTGNMPATDRSYGLINLLFGWIDMIWLRRVMAILSVTILLVFTVQQTMIIKRVGQIEERMTGATTTNILEYQKGIQAVQYEENDISGFEGTDSVKVSLRDLGRLVGSYRELQSRYGRLKALSEGVDVFIETENEELQGPLSN
jgi:hypothetical protein